MEEKEERKKKKEFEKWRIREELSLAIGISINNAIKDFKSTTIDGYKPTVNDINFILSKLLNKRLNK